MTKVNFKNINKPEEVKIYKIGDMFTIEGYSSLYVLAKGSAPNTCNLVSLTTGNRFTKDFDVEHVANVTSYDIEKGTDTNFSSFKHLKEVTIIIHE